MNALAKPIDRTDEVARNLSAQRQIRELTLAERTGVLVQVVDAKEMVYAAMAAFKNRFAMSSEDVGDQLAAATGNEPRFFRQHLREFQRRSQQYFVESLQAQHAKSADESPPSKRRAR